MKFQRSGGRQLLCLSAKGKVTKVSVIAIEELVCSVYREKFMGDY